MAVHPKVHYERQRDKRKLKQVALLWWTQTLYRLSLEACGYRYDAENACGDTAKAPEPNDKFEQVAGILDGAVTKLGGSACSLGWRGSSESIRSDFDARVALLWRTQALYRLAHQKCKTEDLYDFGKNYLYREEVIKVLAEICDSLRPPPPPTPRAWWRQILEDQEEESARPRSNCNSDADCPDDYICVEATCEFLFPSD